MSVDRLISIKLPICQYVAYWELIKLISTDPFLSVVFLLCAGASWGVPLMANQLLLLNSWTERNKKWESSVGYSSSFEAVGVFKGPCTLSKHQSLVISRGIFQWVAEGYSRLMVS